MRKRVEPAPHTAAGLRAWLGAVVLSAPALVVTLDGSVLFVALPTLSVDLEASGTEQLWILDIYVLMVASLSITMGRLSDQLGRRKVLLWGAVIFSLSSLFTAFSNSPEMLVASRAVLGIGGAALLPSSLALIRTMFDDLHQRGVAVALWMSCSAIGTVMGPAVGGVLMDRLWWGAAFLLAVPVMLLLLVVGPVLLPESRSSHTPPPDLVSVALSLSTALLVVYGAQHLQADGGAWQWAAMGAGLAIGLIFLHRQRMSSNPLIDPRLFSSRSFRAVFVLTLAGSGMMAIFTLSISRYLQMVRELSPSTAGLWMMPQAVAIVVAIYAAPWIARLIRPAYVMLGALMVAGAGSVVLGTVDSTTTSSILMMGSILAGAGLGAALALGTNLAVGSVPRRQAGVASSVLTTGNEFGIVLGLAGLGSVANVVYRNRVDVPEGLPHDAVSATQEGLEGATRASHLLPPDVADRILEEAKAAFVDGLNVIAVIGAGLFATMAAMVATLLVRQRGQTPGR